MEVAASAIAVVQLSDRVISLCGQYAMDVRGAREDIFRLSREAQHLRSVIENMRLLYNRDLVHAASSDTIMKLDPCVQDCKTQLSELVAKLDPGNGRALMKRFGLRALTWPLRGRDVTRIVEALERQKTTILMALNVDQTINDQISTRNRHIEKLAFADGARFDSTLWEQRPMCLQDTRVDLLQIIQEWSTAADSPGIFWLRGMAGTGKSTVARTVANTFATEGRLGASFFFSRGKGDLSSGRKFSTSISSQLASTTPSLASYIAAALSEDPQISQRGVREQWKHLVVLPLSRLQDSPSSRQLLCFVIDALDECDGEDGAQGPASDIQLVLQLLLELEQLQSKVRLRVFLTSRPDIHIRRSFHQMPEEVHQDFSLHDIEDSITQRDIRRYLSHELEKFRGEFDIPPRWPKPHEIEELAQNANNLFIYAATISRFLRRSKLQPPGARLAPLLLGKPTSNSPSGELDRMYTQVLRLAVVGSSDEEESREPASQFRSIFGPLILLYNPLSSVSLSKLLGLSEDLVFTVLDNVQAIVDVPQARTSAVQLLHPSLRDFLLDTKRCSDPAFWIDQKHWHGVLFTGCLRVMSDHLRRDICGVSHPGTLNTDVDEQQINEAIPLHVQYACRYWASHLEHSGMSSSDRAQVGDFLCKRFLHWVEAISLLGFVSEGIRIIEQLRLLFSANQIEDRNLSTLLYDAKRFLLKFRSAIEIAPLQIYSSALIFSPHKSRVRNLFAHEISSWILSSPEIQQEWDNTLKLLEGHIDVTTSVAFSPDGKLIASASQDRTIKMWDTVTGTLCSTLESHSGGVNAVSFSPDGKVVASASSDQTIKLWDADTGALRSTLDDHSDWVNAVVFSPDGKVVASASSDQTVKLWDTDTGALRRNLTGHCDIITTVDFSPDGKLIASASDDETLRLWDVDTGALRNTLAGHSSWVHAAVFSPDNGIVASASSDRRVKLWDTATGALRSTLKGHSKRVNAVAFSPDGTLVASTSHDRTARLWDVNTSVLRHTLKGHHDLVLAIAFSPNGDLVASASQDNTVRLWNTDTGTLRTTLEGHSHIVQAVVFSPDGTLIATASQDCTVRLWSTKTGTSHEPHPKSTTITEFSLNGILATTTWDRRVRLWDADTGALRNTLEGHCRPVLAVELSPDGKMVASASCDQTIKLWDADTGALHSILKGHSNWVDKLAFSPDGKVIASASHRRVKLWDTVTGSLSSTLEGHSARIQSVAFSHDGKSVISASWDGTARLWSVDTGKLQSALGGHRDNVNAVTFSPDGASIASASEDDTVRLWDTNTGALRHTLVGHSDSVSTVTFSPDGKIVASASWDETARLWDSTTGTLRSILEDHSDIVNAVAFSPDGALIASASDDGTIKLWSVDTGSLRSTLEGHAIGVNAVIFSADGTVLSSASNDTVKIWDVHTETLRNTFEGRSYNTKAVAFSPNCTFIASAADGDTVRLWDVHTGVLHSTLQGHLGTIRAVAFSADGHFIASASEDDTIKLWDVTTGALRNTLEGHLDSIVEVAFSPDGTLIASASDDDTVRLWDVNTGTSRNILEGHLDIVNAVAFSPDGALIASASNDDTIRLWNVDTGTLRSTCEGHSDLINAALFSPDDKVIASASNDATVRLWDATTGALRNTLQGSYCPWEAVAFSPDGKIVASASHRMVRLWDTTTGSAFRDFMASGVTWLDFSPEGSLLTTNLGKIAITTSSELADSNQNFLLMRDNWLVYRGQKLLWLPSDYHYIFTRRSGGLFVFSSLFSFIEIDLSRFS